MIGSQLNTFHYYMDKNINYSRKQLRDASIMKTIVAIILG